MDGYSNHQHTGLTEPKIKQMNITYEERDSVKVSTGSVQCKKERTKAPLQATDLARFKHIQAGLSNR